MYCYELYHQLRLLDAKPTGRAGGAPRYRLSGELDKAGLGSVTDGGMHKPDFVWHIPGQAEGNAAVIEVKHVDGLNGLTKDMETLAAFLVADQGRAYSLGVLLVFGDTDPEGLFRKVQSAFARCNERHVAPQIRVLHHGRAGFGPEDLGPLLAAGPAGPPIPPAIH